MQGIYYTQLVYEDDTVYYKVYQLPIHHSYSKSVNVRINRRNRRPTNDYFASRPGHDAAVAVCGVLLLHLLHFRAATPSPNRRYADNYGGVSNVNSFYL